MHESIMRLPRHNNKLVHPTGAHAVSLRLRWMQLLPILLMIGPKIAFAQVGRVGINTNAPAAALHVADSNVVFTGTFPLPASPGPLPVQGGGVRMMWYSDKGAFRAGRVLGTNWDKDSIGIYSFAAGSDTKAKGANSIALGSGVDAIGNSSIAIGSGGDGAFGVQAVGIGVAPSAYGAASTAIGLFASTKPNAQWSTAIGNNTQALGAESLASGSWSWAQGTGSVAAGYWLFSNAYGGMAVGLYNDTVSASRTTWVPTDPVFMVGNGTGGGNGRNTAMTILKNGKMGIGTMQPAFGLHLQSSEPGEGSFTSGAMIENSSATLGEAALSFRNKSMPSNRQWTMGLNQGPKLAFNYGSTFSNGNSHLVIDTTGRVGINTVNPDVMLHVVRNDTVSGPIHANALAVFESNFVSYLQFSSENTDAAGIISGNQDTDIRSGIFFGNDSTVLIRAGGNTTRISVEANGNVGVGTLTPAARLDVNGTVKLGTNGSVLNEVIKATVNANLPSVAAGATHTQTFAVTNAATTSAVGVSQGGSFNDGFVIASARVSAANTVEVRFVNTAGSAYDPPAMDFHFTIIR